MNYGWIIETDNIDDGRSIGKMGPRNIDSEIVKGLLSGSGLGFKIYDDDGELYYTGRYIGRNDENQFAPLDDFGGPNAGATEIRYLIDGKWRAL